MLMSFRLAMVLAACLIFGGAAKASVDDAIRDGDVEAVREMLEADPAILEPASASAWTPLHRAAAAGRIEILKLLLDRGAEIDRARWRRSALYYAVENDHAAVVTELLDRGADVHQVIPYDRRPVHHAAHLGHVAVLEALIAGGGDIDARCADQGTPLHYAAVRDRRETVRWLIERGAALDAQDRWGWSPLHRSTFRGQAAARLLLEHGADHARRSIHGTTPLHAAAISNNHGVARLLLDAGADVDARAEDGGTPLDRAARAGSTTTAVLLIERGGAVDAQTRDGWRPLHHAASVGADAIVKELLEAGAAHDPATDDARTPLYLAVERDQPHVARRLLEHGAAVDAQMSRGEDAINDGITPLMRGAERRGAQLVELLLEHGAEVSQRDRWQRTALHRAVRRGEHDTVRVLLEHGAPVGAVDAYGLTPLDMAELGRHHETRELLIAHGAEPAASGRERAETVTVDADAAVAYLRAARKPNGAFGPHENPYTDIAWTYPAVAALKLLGESVESREQVLEHGTGWVFSHGVGAKYSMLAMRAKLHRMLDSDMNDADDVRRNAWSLRYQPVSEIRSSVGIDGNRNRSVLEFHNVSAVWYLIDAIEAMGGTVRNVDEVVAFLHERQTDSGAWVEDFDPELGIASAVRHVAFTSHAVRALHALGEPVPQRERVIEWLRACQEKAGGFRRAPLDHAHDAESPADYQPDIWYTFEALAALDALDAEPRDADAARRWINSLQNHDGGFGDQPGWRSRLMSTYHALRSLELLTSDARAAVDTTAAPRPVREPIPDGKYRIFAANHQTPPGGPEMVDEIERMGYDLVGVSRGNMLGPAGRYLAESGRRAPHLHAVLEAQNHRSRYLGYKLGHHIANYFIPYQAALNPDRRARWRDTRDAIREPSRAGLDWPEYRQRVLMPIVNLHTLFMPESDWEMAFAYIAYQDGDKLRRGYNVVHAAHFNGPDRIRATPYRERTAGRITPIADTDSHGDVHEWRDQLQTYRTLYLARTPALDDYIDAVLHGRAATVIRDHDTEGQLTWYGRPEVVEHL